MATTAQVVSFPAGGDLAEITRCLDALEKVDSALKDLADESNSHLAKQIAAELVGKPKLDPDSVLTKYKAMEAKRNQLKEKQDAITFMRDELVTRLKELKSSSPTEFDQVLNKRMAEQEKVRDKAQEEVRHADKKLKELGKFK
jgi:hypothetical protein